MCVQTKLGELPFTAICTSHFDRVPFDSVIPTADRNTAEEVPEGMAISQVIAFEAGNQRFNRRKSVKDCG